jgi:hypothetical protein
MGFNIIDADEDDEPKLEEYRRNAQCEKQESLLIYQERDSVTNLRCTVLNEIPPDPKSPKAQAKYKFGDNLKKGMVGLHSGLKHIDKEIKKTAHKTVHTLNPINVVSNLIDRGQARQSRGSVVISEIQPYEKQAA